MAAEGPNPGRLVALEGCRGPDLPLVGKRLVRHLLHGGEEGGVSSVDASGLFFELRKGDKHIPQPSPRTLILLYAADLVFRLRWEIRPALQDGYLVVAAPYIETAVAFGRAAGLPKRWLVDLFKFAPPPDAVYRLKEKKETGPWKVKRSEGFVEFAIKTLMASSPAWIAADLRNDLIAHLEQQEKRGAAQTVPDKVLKKE